MFTFPGLSSHRQFVEILGKEFNVSKIFLHASHNQPKYTANDIAILELNKQADDDEINDPICIEEAGPSIKSSIAVVKQAGASITYAKIIPSIRNECDGYMSAGQFCRRVQSNNSAQLQIIGVVAIDMDENRKHTLAGFTSTAIRTNSSYSDSKPFVFTDARFHLNWIKAAIGDNLIQSTTPDDLTSSRIGSNNLSSCEISGSVGFCVTLDECKLFREAPKPLSASRIEYLENLKCFTSNGNSIKQDGFCCPEIYVESAETRIGIEALDLKTCGKTGTRNRIINGQEAGLKEFPWVALMKYKVGPIYKFTCGATLISRRFVLTAAHCIKGLPRNFEIEAVRLGEHNLGSDRDCEDVDLGEMNSRESLCNPPVQDVPIAYVLPHPKHNTPKYANDVGLVKLAREPDMSQGNC